MLNSVDYDKAKLLHVLSCIIWFVEKHAKADAKVAGDEEFQKILGNLQKDLDKYIATLKDSLCK